MNGEEKRLYGADTGTETDPLVPGHRMKPDEPGNDRLIEVVTTLRCLVHVAAENLIGKRVFR
jgi:hypothetical protein